MTHQRAVRKNCIDNNDTVNITNTKTKNINIAPSRFKVIEKLTGRQSGLVGMKKNLINSFVRMRPMLMKRLEIISSSNMTQILQKVDDLPKTTCTQRDKTHDVAENIYAIDEFLCNDLLSLPKITILFVNFVNRLPILLRFLSHSYTMRKRN